ncbi:XRE family transcriptional regulator [Microbacterium bovistercoris]|uniref:XRE family transcriptional regulator n=1 Tax=Microbacterium bovistercoris TaxID=2293570 RepID=A0A371NUW1_9MICO|nr:helix-turn-helix transcriptional regulator [Microbacterium bovistercoris]REJ06288.1 XRE family transcriptional regulator [Microbacterium bovistercoris]
MPQRPSDGLGARLAYYRNLSGLSAERLSKKVPMSRAVISNIESGRKKDVTLDEVIALAWALGIPPVALALPIEQPNVFLDVAEGEGVAERVRAWTAIEWFLTGQQANHPATPQQMIAQNRIKMLLDYTRTRERVVRARAEIARGADTATDWSNIIDEEEARLRDLAEGLTGLGIDLTDYKVDETGLPNGDD